jgi:hypothetical protein
MATYNRPSRTPLEVHSVPVSRINLADCRAGKLVIEILNAQNQLFLTSFNLRMMASIVFLSVSLSDFTPP